MGVAGFRVRFEWIWGGVRAGSDRLRVGYP